VIAENLIKKLGTERVKINEPLAKHVNLKVGGAADLYFEAENSVDLREAVEIAISEQVPFVVIGNGANVLVSDKGVRGLVIANHSKNLKFLPHGFVEVDSGVDNTHLIREAKNRGLIGTERLLKVPGTIGGAVYMNAGDTGRKRFFDDLVVWVEVFDREGEVKKIQKEDCNFGYRSSRFHKSGEIILRVKLQLKQARKEQIEEAAKDILVRKMHQPPGPSVGSTFKNPEGAYAGKLIEQCSLKGKKIGGARISERHANFIINEGDATAADVKALIDLGRKSVKEKFNIDLKEEVRYIGEWD
jgi:UDP-N-acetylmuramate dehydrogenase